MQRSGGAVILMEREKIENKITRLAGGWQFHEIKARKPFDQNVMEFLRNCQKRSVRMQRQLHQWKREPLHSGAERII